MADKEKPADKPAETLLQAEAKPSTPAVNPEIEARMRGEHAKVSAPVAPPRPIRQKAEPMATVDEEKEVAIKVLHSSIIFRPHQKLFSPRLYKLAVEYGIKLRNVNKDLAK